MESKRTSLSAVIAPQDQAVQPALGTPKQISGTKDGAGQLPSNSDFIQSPSRNVNSKKQVEGTPNAICAAAVVPKKDMWDKLTALSPIISGFLIFITGFYCTYTYNQQQIRIQQCQTIEKFIPHLMGNEQTKKAAILALSTLINTETASKFASIFASTGTVSALQSLSKSGSDKDKLIAAQALSTALQSLADRESQLSNIEADYKKALLDKSRQAGTGDNPDTPYNLNKLAQVYISQGQYALAEPLLKKALEIRERVYGPGHQEVAETLKSLAELYQLSGRSNLAEAALKRARDIESKSGLAPEVAPATTEQATKIQNADSSSPRPEEEIKEIKSTRAEDKHSEN
jgi:tetratricopeptide (TPR) repeat protein